MQPFPQSVAYVVEHENILTNKL